MLANLGSVDRVMRLALGIAILGYSFMQEGALRWVAVVGIILIATAAIKFCPLYRILGLSSLRAMPRVNR